MSAKGVPTLLLFRLDSAECHSGRWPPYLPRARAPYLGSLREARTVSALSHPHIATTHDYGETEDGQPYFVMELVKVESGQRFGSRSVLPQLDALRLQAITETVKRDFGKAVEDYRALASSVPEVEEAYALVDRGRAYEKNEPNCHACKALLTTKLSHPKKGNPKRWELRVAVVSARSEFHLFDFPCIADTVAVGRIESFCESSRVADATSSISGLMVPTPRSTEHSASDFDAIAVLFGPFTSALAVFGLAEYVSY